MGTGEEEETRTTHLGTWQATIGAAMEEEDIDLELGHGKEGQGQQKKTEEKAAEEPPAAKSNWNWKKEVPFLLLGVMYMALGVFMILVFKHSMDNVVARKMFLWLGGCLAALGGGVFLRFVAGIFKSPLVATDTE